MIRGGWVSGPGPSYPWSGRAADGGPSGPWEPDDADGDAVLWLDPTDASNYTLVGSDLSSWTNKGMVGGTWTQTTSADRPSLATVGGKPMFYFDGSEFLIGHIHDYFPTNTPWIAGFQATIDTSSFHLILDNQRDAVTPQFQFSCANHADYKDVYFGDGSGPYSSQRLHFSYAYAGAFFSYLAKYGGANPGTAASITAYANGVLGSLAATGGTSDDVLTRSTIGCRGKSTPDIFMVGHVGKLVVIHNHSADDLTNLLDYIAA